MDKTILRKLGVLALAVAVVSAIGCSKGDDDSNVKKGADPVPFKSNDPNFSKGPLSKGPGGMTPNPSDMKKGGGPAAGGATTGGASPDTGQHS